MKSLKIIALVVALVPTQSFANKLLSKGELSYLIKTCFETFYHPGGQPFQVDRKKFAAMGFSTSQDDGAKFKAQRVLSQQVMRFKKESFGPRFETRRHKRKPNALLHKVCSLEGDTAGKVTPVTNLSSAQAQKMLESEAKRRGFKPYRNAKGREVWIKGDVAVFLGVSFRLARGEAVTGKQLPTSIYVDGVHPKDLRGIK